MVVDSEGLVLLPMMEGPPEDRASEVPVPPSPRPPLAIGSDSRERGVKATEVCPSCNSR